MANRAQMEHCRIQLSDISYRFFYYLFYLFWTNIEANVTYISIIQLTNVVVFSSRMGDMLMCCLATHRTNCGSTDATALYLKLTNRP